MNIISYFVPNKNALLACLLRFDKAYDKAYDEVSNLLPEKTVQNLIVSLPEKDPNARINHR